MTPLVNIRCRPLGASLSRSACGQRYLAAVGPGRPQVSRLQCGACRDCELGPAHARGETPATWADGAAVEEVVHVVAGSVLPVKSHKGPAVPAYVPRVRKLTDALPPPRTPNPSGRNQFSRSVKWSREHPERRREINARHAAKPEVKARSAASKKRLRAERYRQSPIVYTCAECGSTWCRAPWVRSMPPRFCGQTCRGRALYRARKAERRAA